MHAFYSQARDRRLIIYVLLPVLEPSNLQGICPLHLPRCRETQEEAKDQGGVRPLSTGTDNAYCLRMAPLPSLSPPRSLEISNLQKPTALSIGSTHTPKKPEFIEEKEILCGAGFLGSLVGSLLHSSQPPARQLNSKEEREGLGVF